MKEGHRNRYFVAVAGAFFIFRNKDRSS